MTNIPLLSTPAEMEAKQREKAAVEAALPLQHMIGLILLSALMPLERAEGLPSGMEFLGCARRFALAIWKGL